MFIVINSSFLTRFKTFFDGRDNTWYYKPSQKPIAGEVIGPNEEPTTIALLNVVKLLSKYLHLYLQIVTALSLNQRCFFFFLSVFLSFCNGQKLVQRFITGQSADISNC